MGNEKRNVSDPFGTIERIVVGGETLSYAQFVGRYSAAVQSGVNALWPESRCWRDGRTKVGAGGTVVDCRGRMAA